MSFTGSFNFDLTTILNSLDGFMETVTFFLGNFFRFFQKMGLSVRDFFRTIWDKFIKNGLLKVLHLLAKLRAWAERIFGPILRLLRKIRDWLDKVYYPRLLKVINMIQRVRQLLTVLRIFNVAWAKRLDERLLRLERKIIEPYTILRNAINLVSTYLNLILDPTLILRANPLIAGIIGALGQLVRGIFGIGFSGIVGNGQVLPPRKNAGSVTRADAVAISRGLLETDTGYGKLGVQGRDTFLALFFERAP